MLSISPDLPARFCTDYHHDLNLVLDHHEVDNLQRLCRDSGDVLIIDILDLGDERATVRLSCRTAEVRDRMWDAW